MYGSVGVPITNITSPREISPGPPRQMRAHRHERAPDSERGGSAGRTLAPIGVASLAAPPASPRAWLGQRPIPDSAGLGRLVRLALLGLPGRDVAIWGSFQFFTQVVGTHITDCDFDANGAYAEVRVNNLLGWVPHRQEVWVDFYLDGREFAEQ